MRVDVYSHKNSSAAISVYLMVEEGGSLPKVTLKDPPWGETSPEAWTKERSLDLNSTQPRIGVNVRKALSDIESSGYHIGASSVTITEHG